MPGIDPGGGLPAQVGLSRSQASRSDNPSNACSTITVATTRAGTVGWPFTDPVYRSAK